MQKLATPTALLILPVLIVLFGQCQNNPPNATPQVYLSADRNETNQRWTNECAFRYTIANTTSKLDNNSQHEAIQAGFGVWQRITKNVNFLEFSTADRAILTVRFVNPDDLQTGTIAVAAGLLSGSATVLSALRIEKNGTYSILLRNDVDWNTNTLSRAVAYHVGLLLGMATSTDANSLMWPVLKNQLTVPSGTDSILVNRLYLSPCGNYLPISFPVNSPTTKTIKLDKQGSILIKASGQINVGIFVGVSTPDGKTEGGVLGLSLADYSIVPAMFHGALMYKLNDETNWRYCGKECTFPTAGNQSVNLTFNVNDNNQTDNVGAYDVTVQYK